MSSVANAAKYNNSAIALHQISDDSYTPVRRTTGYTYLFGICTPRRYCLSHRTLRRAYCGVTLQSRTSIKGNYIILLFLCQYINSHFNKNFIPCCKQLLCIF